MTPKFLGLNANRSNMVKATDFKFDTTSQGQYGHDHQKFFQKGAWSGSYDP